MRARLIVLNIFSLYIAENRQIHAKCLPFLKISPIYACKMPLYIDFVDSRIPLKNYPFFLRKWVRAWYTFWSGVGAGTTCRHSTTVYTNEVTHKCHKLIREFTHSIFDNWFHFWIKLIPEFILNLFYITLHVVPSLTLGNARHCM